MRIRVLDLQTRQLSVLPGSYGLWTARWSPDGRYIAALVVPAPTLSESPAVRLFDVAAHKWTTVAEIKNINEPAWSSDSRYIYFHTEGRDAALISGTDS